MRFTSRFTLTGLLATLSAAIFMAGCGGGGSSGPVPDPNPFAGSYKGVYFVTAGKNAGDARFFSLKVLASGAISSEASSLNAAAGTVKDDGKIAFTRREGDSTTTSALGQLLLPGIGTMIAKNTGGDEFLAALSRINSKKTSFDGNYYGTTRVRTGTGVGTVEAIAVGVKSSGATTILLTNANGTSRQLTGTANLTTGALTATGPAGADTITITVQLAKTGQAGGAFDTPTSHGTVALNKSN